MKRRGRRRESEPWTPDATRLVTLVLAPALAMGMMAVTVNGDLPVFYAALSLTVVGLVSAGSLLFGWASAGIKGLAFSFIIGDAVLLYLIVFMLQH